MMNSMFQLQKVFMNRVKDVLNSRADTVLSNLKIFFEFINSEPLLRSILEELTMDLPDPKEIISKIKTERRIVLPSSYLEKVKACLSILLYIMEKNENLWQLMVFTSTFRDADILTKEALEEFFVPVYRYIDEKITSIDSFQFLIIRFKLKCEWFERENLFNLYNRDTSKGESVLDKALREYLFDQGIIFPFSKPSSPSGEVDVLSIVKQKPIPLEVKVFDGGSRSKNYIRQGFRQALNYAKDYGEPSAYLVIFNVSPYDLIFKLRSTGIPQRLVIGNKTIYMLTINLYPHQKPASKRHLKTYEITEEYLLESQEQ